MTQRVLSMFLAAALIAAPVAAHAVCGDVTGDDEIKTTDALAVLKAAVGQNPDLECTADPLRPSQLRLFNALQCSNGNDDAVLETDHGQEWEAEDFEDYSSYQVLETSTIEGFNYKQCSENIRFDGPFTMPPERKLYVYVLVGDPDFYGDNVFFLVVRDEGARAGAPPSEDLVYGAQSFGVMGRRVD